MDFDRIFDFFKTIKNSCTRKLRRPNGNIGVTTKNYDPVYEFLCVLKKFKFLLKIQRS
jgi:hypothetical protein